MRDSASNDATAGLQAGYVGDDVESVLHKLLVEAGGDLERAERGIVYIDEIDKISRKGGENVSITYGHAGVVRFFHARSDERSGCALAVARSLYTISLSL